MKPSPASLRLFSPRDLGLGGLIVFGTIGIWYAGDFHALHNSDSLIHSLNSLYQWTVFVWEYDHIGSLLSLAASPVTRPYWNVLVVSALASFLFLAGLSLWGSLVSSVPFAESSLWISVLTPLVMTRSAVFNNAAHCMPSGPAFFFSGLYVCGLLKYLRPSKRPALLLAMFAAAFPAIYLSKIAFIPLAAITGGLLWEHRPLPKRTSISILACLAVALLCYLLLENASPYRKDYTLSLANIPLILPRLISNWGHIETTGLFWLAAPILIVLFRPNRRNPLLIYAIAGVVLQSLIVSGSRWAALNGYAAHYLYDLAFVTFLAVIELISNFLRRFDLGRFRRGVMAVVGVFAVGANVYVWGPLSFVNPLSKMERTLGGNTPAIVKAQCDLVAGQYWTVWPAMLAANDYYYRNNILDPETHRPRRIFGIAYLARSTGPLWRPILDRPDVRLCSFVGDEAWFKRNLSIYAPDIALQTERAGQIDQVVIHRISNVTFESVTLEFDDLAPGRGWSAGEIGPNGETFQWMESTEATIVLPLASEHALQIEFRIINAMSSEILQSLRVTINDQPVDLDQRRDASGATIYGGVIPHSALAADARRAVVAFHVNRTLVPAFALSNSGDPRTLAIAFDWLRLAPSRRP